MIYKIIPALISVAALAAPLAAHAEEANVTLKGNVQLEKVVVDKGVSRKVLAEPTVVVPGDRLVFSTSYANGGRLPATEFVITNPLPTAVTLAPDGAEALTVSVDGGKTWGHLSKLSMPDGNGGTRPAVAADVTHVRWVVAQIAPGGAGKVTYNAIVR